MIGALSALAVVAAGLGAVTLSSSLASSSAPPASLGASSEGGARADSDPSDRASDDRVTPDYEIASGQRDGQKWALVGFLAEEGKRRLCLQWRQGDRWDGVTACFSDLVTDLPSGEEIVTNTVQGPVYGEVAEGVSQVELHFEDGSSRQAAIYPSPAGLQLPFNFFVSFAPSSQDMEVVAKDRNGKVLERELHPGLPVLTVAKVGSGTGGVVGYSTEEALCESNCPASPTEWINCGTLCSAELDRAAITLEAHPHEGSKFVGWEGPCTGMTRCQLTVDRDVLLEARFETTD